MEGVSSCSTLSSRTCKAPLCLRDKVQASGSGPSLLTLKQHLYCSLLSKMNLLLYGCFTLTSLLAALKYIFSISHLWKLWTQHRPFSEKWKWKSLSHVRLCNPMDYTVHGILQARILEWMAVPFSRGSSQPSNWTQVSCTAGGFFTSWATRGLMPFSDYTQFTLSCSIKPSYTSRLKHHFISWNFRQSLFFELW